MIPKTSFWDSRMTHALFTLGIAIAVIAAVVLSGSQSAGAAATVNPEIEGTWLAIVTVPDGPPPFPSLLTYGRGGALVTTDSSGSPALGNVYQGTWIKTGPHKYAFTMVGFNYDETGALIGYFRVHETVELEPGGQAYDGQATLEFLDIDQNVIGRGTSTSHATRIDAN